MIFFLVAREVVPDPPPFCMDILRRGKANSFCTSFSFLLQWIHPSLFPPPSTEFCRGQRKPGGSPAFYVGGIFPILPPFGRDEYLTVVYALRAFARSFPLLFGPRLPWPPGQLPESRTRLAKPIYVRSFPKLLSNFPLFFSFFFRFYFSGRTRTWSTLRGYMKQSLAHQDVFPSPFSALKSFLSLFHRRGAAFLPGSAPV